MNRCLVALLVTFAAAVGAQTAPAPRPSVKVGDTAVYDLNLRADNQRFELTTTVTHADDSRIRAKLVQPGRTPAELDTEYDAEWNPVVSGAGTRFDPPSRVMSFPLEVGKSWESKYNATLASGARVRGDADNKVLAFEKVTTPAGVFDAWKVQNKGWINGISFQGAFDFTQTQWYAPSIGRVVRSEYKEGRRGGADNVLELKSFKPGP